MKPSTPRTSRVSVPVASDVPADRPFPDEAVHVAFCCDAAYATPMVVAVQSVLRTARAPENLVFWIGTTAPDLPHALAVREVIERANARLHVRLLTSVLHRLQDAPVRGHLSSAAYFRLFLTDLLPPNLRRVIYLDSDVVVCHPIEELWTTPLDGQPMAGVLKPRATEALEVGVPSESDYFNSGVLLIDLEAWRRLEVGRRALGFVQHHPGRIHGHDQPALNHVFAGAWKRLDLRWNQQFKFFVHTARYLGIPAATLRELRAHPFIIHYTTGSKPWHYSNDHPLQRRYFEVLDETRFAGWRPRAGSLRVWLRRTLTGWFPHTLRPGVLRNVLRPGYRRLVSRLRGHPPIPESRPAPHCTSVV